MQREAENALEFVRKTRFGVIVATINGQLGLIRTLRGLTPAFGSLSDGEFDEGRFEQHLEDDPRLVYAGWRYWIRKLQARYLRGRLWVRHCRGNEGSTAAVEVTVAAGVFRGGRIPFLWRARASGGMWLCPVPTSDARTWRRSSPITGRLQLWAENCPENFADRATLVGAEIARLEGRELDAMRLYEAGHSTRRASTASFRTKASPTSSPRASSGARLDDNS